MDSGHCQSDTVRERKAAAPGLDSYVVFYLGCDYQGYGDCLQTVFCSGFYFVEGKVFEMDSDSFQMVLSLYSDCGLKSGEGKARGSICVVNGI